MAKNFSTFRQKCQNFWNKGVIGWKLVKMGVFRWKRAKKVGSFWWHMARNPKLSAPRGYIVSQNDDVWELIVFNMLILFMIRI